MITELVINQPGSEFGVMMSRLPDNMDTINEVCSVQVYENNNYTDWGDLPCILFLEQNSNEVKCISINDTRVGIGDRIIFKRTVYDIANRINDVLGVKKNDLESSFLKLEDMGIPIEQGIQVPVREPLSEEDERFVDHWVGIWTRNVARNYDIISHSEGIKGIKNKCSGTSAVVVGAGPSLDKNIDELKGINAIIIATDRAYKPLLARGIEPDLVVSVDCHDDIILGYLDKVDSSNHLLIMNTAEDYQIARMWQGKILYFNMGHIGMQFCDRVLPFIFPNFMAVANVGCVGNTALIVGNWIGCKPLILVGYDYGYPDEKISCNTYDYINGVFCRVDINERERFEKRTGKIKKDGIYTYPPFLDYLKTMEALEKSQKFNIVNATEGGIIDNLPKLSLKQAKQKYCSKDIKTIKQNLRGGN